MKLDVGFVRASVLMLALTSCRNPDRVAVEVTFSRLVVQADGSECFQPCTESSAARNAIGLTYCANLAPASCSGPGGEAQLRIVADFGDVEFDHPEQLKANLAVTMDDKAVSGIGGPMTTSAAPAAHAVSLIAIPARGGSVRFDVDAGSGDVSSSATLQVSAPVFDISVAGCSSDPCAATAFVGNQTLVIEAPANVDPPAALVDTFVDDIPASSSTMIALADVGGGRKAGSFPFDVPATGSRWKLRAHVGDQSLMEKTILLTPPTITARIPQCATSPCTLKAGTMAAVRIDAPIHLRTTDVAVHLRVDGIEQTGVFAGKLADCAAVAGGTPTACTSVPITVAASPAMSIQAFASVGVYGGSTEVAAVAP